VEVAVSFRADLAGIPEQLRASLVVEGGTFPANTPLLLGGMGGSAAAGDFFRLSVMGRRRTFVLREASLPENIYQGTTLIVISYSGDTEESLSLWRDARERGVTRAVVTSGGTLARAAEEESCSRVLVPSGLAPRNALGYLLQGLCCLAGASDAASEWAEASRHLASIRTHAADGDPMRRRIADLLEASNVPVLLAGDVFTLAAANRWRASLAENAKVAAAVWELPEAAHNRIVTAGRDGPRRKSLGLFALGTPREARALTRWDAVLQTLEAHGSTPLRVNVPHALPWVEALGLAYFGDWMSLELAERLGVDPEPITLMTDVKLRLRQGKDSAS